MEVIARFALHCCGDCLALSKPWFAENPFCSRFLNDDSFWDEDARIAFKIQPADAESFKVMLGASLEEVGITTTTNSTTTEPTTRCTIATAAYGPDVAPEVAYVRNGPLSFIIST